MNNFVTNFAVFALLESYELGTIPINKDEIKIALDGLLDFKDKNYETTTPVYTFWKQINVNGTWEQCPDTMYNIISNIPTFSESTFLFLEKIGLGYFANLLRTFNVLSESFMYAYRIPSDVDDTSVYMGLTGRIHKLKEVLGDTADNWLSINTDFESLFKTFKKYSYRPFLNYTRQNGSFNNETSDYADLLDPRSYYPIRGYLEQTFKTAEEQG